MVNHYELDPNVAPGRSLRATQAKLIAERPAPSLAHGVHDCEIVGLDGQRWRCFCGLTFPTYPIIRRHSQEADEAALLVRAA